MAEQLERIKASHCCGMPFISGALDRWAKDAPMGVSLNPAFLDECREFHGSAPVVIGYCSGCTTFYSMAVL